MRQAFSRWAIPCTRSAAMPMTVGWRGRSCKLLSYGAFSTSCMHCSSTTHASHVDATDGGKGPDGHPKRSSSLPRGAAGSSPPQLLGVSRVTAASIKDFMNTKVPLFLYFTMSGHAEVNAYTDLVCYQVDQANRRLQAENMADIYQEFGVDAGLGIKLGIVNCQEEPGLTHKFGVDPNCFPIIYFIRSSLVFDRLSGIVAESQVKESIDAFVDYAREESGKEKNGEGFFEQIKRHDNDDENAMTLMNVAHQALQKKELAKAKKLFQKAFDASVAEIRALEEKYSIHKKKMDNDLWFKLKKYGCYSTAPEALCGMAMCALASDDNEQAHSLVQRVRSEYPFATKDLRKVAEAVVRVELLILTGFDPNRDTFTSLLKYDSFYSDPVDFYKHHLRLAMAHYVENQPRLAIEECLKLIRAEVKLLPALKSGGIVDENLRLGPTAVTPARKALLGFFEALGPTHEEVVKGRKLMQLYV